MEVADVADVAGAQIAVAASIPPFPPSWLERFTYELLERLAIRTVDGGMTDDEALIAEGLMEPGRAAPA